MRLTEYISLRIFLPALLVIASVVAGSCGGSGDGSDYTHPPVARCDLDSQRNEQRLSGERREDYYPERFSSDLNFSNYGADISPTEKHRDIARKVSRSVLEVEVREGNKPYYKALGTGWLIAPKYAVTAAHTFRGIVPGQERVFIHTFDGRTIEAEIDHIDRRETDRTDLALLRLKEEIDAVPMKIADRKPLRNEFLMAMGGASVLRGLGGWAVSAGPALELRSEYTGCAVVVYKYENCQEDGCETHCNSERMYHAVPTSGGMSGGPIFNEKGEVVSIVSAARFDREGTVRHLFGAMTFQVPDSPPENLWVYAFNQPKPDSFSFGPNIKELEELYEMIPDSEKPHNAGNYGDNNRWKTSHEFGDKYSPFPLDQFDRMNSIYKEARKSAVTVSVKQTGSGFIYNDNTVVTAGHLATRRGDRAVVTTEDGRVYDGTVSKTQHQEQGCDIAVIKMEEQDAFSEYPKLGIADSPSLKCGDPLVVIGSGDAYNSVGHPQGVGAVYMRRRTYASEFLSHSTASGMSGGPIVDGNGEVVSLSSTTLGRGPEEGEWIKPGPLVIRTRLPVYTAQDFSEGPNAEIIKRFVEDSGFRCPE